MGVGVGRWHGGRRRWGWLSVTIDVVVVLGIAMVLIAIDAASVKKKKMKKKLTCSGGFALICRGWQWQRRQWWSTQVGGGQHVVAVEDAGGAALQRGMSMRGCATGKSCVELQGTSESCNRQTIAIFTGGMHCIAIGESWVVLQ